MYRMNETNRIDSLVKQCSQFPTRVWEIANLLALGIVSLSNDKKSKSILSSRRTSTEYRRDYQHSTVDSCLKFHSDAMGNLLTFLITLFCTSCRPALAAYSYGNHRHAHFDSPITFSLHAFMGLVLLATVSVASCWNCSLCVDANLPNYNIFAVYGARVELPISASGIYRKHERAKFFATTMLFR